MKKLVFIFIFYLSAIGNSLARFSPDLKLSMVMLSNFNSSNLGQKFKGGSEIILEKAVTSNHLSASEKVGTQIPDPNELMLLEGNYWDTYDKHMIQILMMEQGLIGTIGTSERPLQYWGNGENSFSTSDLVGLEGEYYSEELQTSYWVSVKGDGLVAYHPRHGEIPLERIAANAFRGAWPVLSVEIVPDSEAKATEVNLSNGWVKSLRLSRLD
ncbi:hypothetical protein [Algoriphagus sp. CAU 1675]|uniref:hypothetical protein n=1 Tax=Algoriphagus sp. CAU 1675 TaxID=3032597 RepID=UPI0023DC5A5E|nr:hypothetical protein [Algoriphagus sp. CAU 1675]MDF2157111.1 hypothetical protein [Algoriphagus sp. CAU 1675]